MGKKGFFPLNSQLNLTWTISLYMNIDSTCLGVNLQQDTQAPKCRSS